MQNRIPCIPSERELLHMSVHYARDLLYSKNGVLTESVIVYALILLTRYISNKRIIQRQSLHLLFYTCLYISHKITNDEFKRISYFSNTFRMRKTILKKFEMNILQGLYYDTHVSLEDFYYVRKELLRY